MEQIITAGAEESNLSAAARAIQITERIRANGRTAVNAVCAIGEDLRTIKIDGLYTELGYVSFDDYAEKEFGLKRRQAYQYISVYEKLGKEFVQSNAQLGITKLALLATANPEDRAEVMESEDVAKITTRELEQLLAEKKQLGEQLSLLQEEKDDAEKAYSSESDRVQKLVNEQIDKNREIAKLKRELEELKSAPKDVEVAEKEVIKEVPDLKTIKQLAEKEAALKEAKKELAETKAEAELHKKSAENARIEAKRVKDNAKREAEAEIEKSQKEADERVRKAEQEKTDLERQVAELKAAAEKPPENTDKNDFKKILSSVYKEMSGLVSFIKSTEEADKKELYIKKAIEIVDICKDTIMEIQSPVNIDEQSSKSRGVIDINTIPPITSSSAEEGDDE